MSIPGLDNYLTSAPESPDFVEIAESWLKSHKRLADTFEEFAFASEIIRELLTIIEEEI